jgi:hypothetical protein
VEVSGLVGEPPHPKASAAPAAPITPSASRRPTFLLLIVHSFESGESDSGQPAHVTVLYRVRIAFE